MDVGAPALGVTLPFWGEACDEGSVWISAFVGMTAPKKTRLLRASLATTER
jgi:hypothetical protein